MLAILELGEDHCSHCFADRRPDDHRLHFRERHLRTVPYDKFGVTPQEQILTIGREFKMAVEKDETLASLVCARCGDMVVQKYARVQGDDEICIPCQAPLL